MKNLNDLQYTASHDFLVSKAWLRKREAILRRDKYLCQRCLRYGRRREHKEFDTEKSVKIRSTYRLFRHAHLQVGVGIHSDIGSFFCALAAFLSGERTLNESKKEHCNTDPYQRIP